MAGKATVAAMDPEWTRIDLLASCLAVSRRGEPITDETVAELTRLQEEVGNLRRTSVWRQARERYGLDPLDQDMLAFALAPELEPRLGWMFQTLQAGAPSACPSAALVGEMLGLSREAMANLPQRLDERAPLVRHGLLTVAARDIYAPLRATAKARAELLGGSSGGTAPKGAIELPVRGTLADLVLPSHCLRGLREFLLWVTFRETVVDRWGARDSGGPVALFSGPSGTGKTYAAEALAHAVGYPLYRVDLGLLVSKYIGETEKNLNMLFDSAHGQAMLLLFDEADALFGKRGEVKEARDRYANMEVSHLLTRIERHKGPCVLTTNLREAIDPAFVRRFHAVLDFPRPDAEARSRLWRQHLPPRAPLAPELDCRLLGEAVALTGGQIRNAALHAAYLAAGENSVIDLRRIARAVWAELGKEGRERVQRSLGALADHLPQEEDLYADH